MSVIHSNMAIYFRCSSFKQLSLFKRLISIFVDQAHALKIQRLCELQGYSLCESKCEVLLLVTVERYSHCSDLGLRVGAILAWEHKGGKRLTHLRIIPDPLLMTGVRAHTKHCLNG